MMTNKFLPKTVKKIDLLAVILAVVLVLSIVVTAIFGVNYSANKEDNNCVIVTVNSAYFSNEEKRDAIEEICETELDALDVKYSQASKMNGDDCEIVYYFDGDTDLTAAKESLQKKFDAKTKVGAEWEDAFITVSTASQKTIDGVRAMPASYFVRLTIAVAVFATLAFLYTWLRHKLYSALIVLACVALTPLMTAAIAILTRIPFSAYSLYAIAVAAFIGAVASVLTVNSYSKALKKEDKTPVTAEEVVQATPVKANFALALVLGAFVAGIGAVVGLSGYFALTAIIGVDLAYFFGVHFASAMYLPLRTYADGKSSKTGYKGAKKAEKVEE